MMFFNAKPIIKTDSFGITWLKLFTLLENQAESSDVASLLLQRGLIAATEPGGDTWLPIEALNQSMS